MNFREPFSFISSNLSASLKKLEDLFDADSVSSKDNILVFDGLYILGPNHLIDFVSHSKEFFNKFSNADLQSIKKEINIVARSFYAPDDYAFPDLPVVLYYKLVPELNSKPVLVKEFKMKPGELLIVPESSEYLCAISYQDSRMDAKCKLPEEFLWFDFVRDGFTSKTIFNFNLEHADKSIEGRKIQKGNLLYLDKTIFESHMLHFQNQFIDKEYFQLCPFIPDNEYASLKEVMASSDLWIRRTGDIYTQVALDIKAWSELDICPSIVLKIIDYFKNELFIFSLSNLTGINLNSLLEISAYKFVANQFVGNHSDGTFGGALKVRVNWLIQNPKNRTSDMRFWDPFDKNGVVTEFEAIENSITIFKLGDETPHDISPMPDVIDVERINIVLTYG